MKAATLYGKGWSLDAHDFAADDGLRVGINEAARIVPGIEWGVCTDAHQHAAMVEARLPHWYGHEGAACWWSPTNDGKIRCPRVASAALAIWLLGKAGVESVRLVGFDSFYGRQPPKDAAKPTGGSYLYSRFCVEVAGANQETFHDPMRYETINRQISQAAFWACIALEDGNVVDQGRIK